MPLLPAFKKKLGTSKTTLSDAIDMMNMVQDNIKTIFSTLNQKDVLNYAVLPNISLVPGLNLVPHTLNRPLVSWRTRRVRGECRLWDSQDTAQYPNQYLYINSDGYVSVDFEVF